MTSSRQSTSRDRLVEAAAELIGRNGNVDASVRDICERAGVTPPTLYHFFGSKAGLIDAVIEQGFNSYIALKEEAAHGDPVEAIRAGWDNHVRFGLDHPAFYVLMYGRVIPEQRTQGHAKSLDLLRNLAQEAEAQHMLSVSAEEAAERVMAAVTGLTLHLLTDAGSSPELSEGIRDAVMSSITRA